MKSNKTQPTTVSVNYFLTTIKNETRRQDAEQLIKMMKNITGQQPVMWGPSIIGFGSYHYKYQSGREGDMPVAAFSPRAARIVVYLDEGTLHKSSLLQNLGPHKTSKACLYIKQLQNIDMLILKKIIKESCATTTDS